jgi:hypothetical protein
MTGFKIDSFSGVIPRLGNRILPNNAAEVANNVKLFSGELRSWQNPVLIATPSKSGALTSIYRMYTTGTGAQDIWLSWVDDVDVVRGPISGDTQFKIYYTGDSTGLGGPKKTNLVLSTSSGTDYPHAYLEMGVPAPGSAPAVIGTGGTSTVSVTRVYAYTYITNTASWAEEGPPSPLGTGTGKFDATWVISALSTGTAGNYDFANAIKRIYRTLTDNAGNTNWQLALDNVPITTTSTNDTIADANLGIIAPSFINGVVGSEWTAPPVGMKGLIALPNGIMAGFSGNLICFCEPFFPHAWPIRYQLTTNFPIVSLGVYGQTLIVTTTGFPYAVIGSRPDSMAMARIEENHPCVSKRSTVSFPFGVAWATPDGLALAGVGGAINAIEPFMKRDEWQALCAPTTIVAKQYQNSYFGFFFIGNVGGYFVFDRTNATGPLAFGNYAVNGAYFDPETARMYMIINNGIYQWDADANNAALFDWKSKAFILPNPLNFGAAILDADYSQLLTAPTIAQQAATDQAFNLTILGTATNGNDESHLTSWAGTTAYTTSTGSGAPASVVASTNGNYMAICVVAGTSSSVEPTWPVAVGGTATDGTVQWKRIHELQGCTKGALRETTLRSHTQTLYSPVIDGTGANTNGFPLRGSLLLGGQYANIQSRGVTLTVWANGQAISTQPVFSRAPIRLPRGIKTDTWEFEFSGNIPIRLFKVAETSQELARIA